MSPVSTQNDAVSTLRRRSIPRLEPIRRRGEPFFDQMVAGAYSPRHVRESLHHLIAEQYKEADRLSGLRGWGGAQPHGNDRYQFSLEQKRVLKRRLPGAQLLRPKQSLLYRIGSAVVYPMRYGSRKDDCPTTARIEDPSAIQRDLAGGRYHEPLTLFDVETDTPPVVVWLLFTGNSVEGGPLAAYLAIPGGYHSDGCIELPQIEELLPGDAGPYASDAPVQEEPRLLALSPEPIPQLRLRP